MMELCRQGKNFDVMRTMYSPTIVSVEGDGKRDRRPGTGDQESEDWVADKTFHGETVAGPFFNGANPDQSSSISRSTSPPKPPASAITREEVGVYTVNKEDKITREQFFYEGEH